MRDVQEPTVNDLGDEVHPAFGRMVITHRSSTPPVALFDSEIRHNHTVVLTLHTASRKRGLNRDWIHPGKHVVEIEMSEAQWAAMVSSIGNGGGTSCTIRWRAGDGDTPGLPYQPRLALSMAETRGAAEEAFAAAKAAYDALEALPTTGAAKERKAAMRELRAALYNAEPNVAYASKTLVEHAENVVQKARADIEAMVVTKANDLGLSAGQQQDILALTGGLQEIDPEVGMLDDDGQGWDDGVH